MKDNKLDSKKIFSLVVIFSLIYTMLLPNIVVNAKKVDSVVRHCRDVYYKTNENLASYYKNEIKGNYTEYWDMENGILKKAVLYPTSVDDIHLKKYTTEYYYDNDQKLVFAFAYCKSKGKVKEYRAYYGTNGKLYRYINANGKVTDYKKGKKISYSSDNLKFLLYKKGLYYLHIVMESESAV